MGKRVVLGEKNRERERIWCGMGQGDVKNKIGVEGEGVRVGEMKGERELGLELFKEEGVRLIERGGNERKIEHRIGWFMRSG